MGILTTLSAFKNAKYYKPLLEGIRVNLPSGESFNVKLSSAKEITWPVAFRRHGYVTKLMGNGFEGTGCGEDDNKFMAFQKSLSEAFERLIFRNLKGTNYSTYSSNGWACHPNLKLAKQNAMLELLERDAVITHHLKEEEFVEIHELPHSVISWATKALAKSKFRNIRLLISTEGFLPTATVLLTNEKNLGVASHATSLVGLTDAMAKALTEASRILNFYSLKSFRRAASEICQEVGLARYTPAHHAFVYAYENKLPDWMFGASQNWSEANIRWKNKIAKFDPDKMNFKFSTLVDSPLFVVNCKSPCVQDLYFGPTNQAVKSGLINFRRLGVDSVNLNPHFVA